MSKKQCYLTYGLFILVLISNLSIFRVFPVNYQDDNLESYQNASGEFLLPLSTQPTMSVTSEEEGPHYLEVNGKQIWLYGINYPWRVLDGVTCTHDDWHTGEFNIPVDADFRIMKNMGVHVVRWWLEKEMCQNGDFIKFGNNEDPIGFHQESLKRLDYVLTRICPKYDIYLIPTIFSHQMGDPDIDRCKTDYFDNSPSWRNKLLNITASLAEIFPSDDYPYLLAWDLWNEPSWNYYDTKWALDWEKLGYFIGTLAHEMKERDPNCRLTLGDNYCYGLRNMTEGPYAYAWDLSNLDFINLHINSRDGELKDNVLRNRDDVECLELTYTNLISYFASHNKIINPNLQFLIGECYTGFNKEDPDDYDPTRISKVTQNAYNHGYIGVLPFCFQEANFLHRFIDNIDEARKNPDTENTLSSSRYWNRRCHPFMILEDDLWEEVTINSRYTFRTDFSKTDYHWVGTTPRLWTSISEGDTFQDNGDNLKLEDFSEHNLYITLPNSFLLENNPCVSVRLIFKSLNNIGNLEFYQVLSTGEEKRGKYYGQKTVDNRWAIVFDLNQDYYDSKDSSNGGTPFYDINIKIKSQYTGQDLVLYGGQITLYPYYHSSYEIYAEDFDDENAIDDLPLANTNGDLGDLGEPTGHALRLVDHQIWSFGDAVTENFELEWSFLQASGSAYAWASYLSWHCGASDYNLFVIDDPRVIIVRKGEEEIWRCNTGDNFDLVPWHTMKLQVYDNEMHIWWDGQCLTFGDPIIDSSYPNGYFQFQSRDHWTHIFYDNINLRLDKCLSIEPRVTFQYIFSEYFEDSYATNNLPLSATTGDLVDLGEPGGTVLSLSNNQNWVFGDETTQDFVLKWSFCQMTGDTNTETSHVSWHCGGSEYNLYVVGDPRIIVIQDSTETHQLVTGFPFHIGDWYTIRLQMVGNDIHVCFRWADWYYTVDNPIQLDGSCPSGHFKFSPSNELIYFDNVILNVDELNELFSDEFLSYIDFLFSDYTDYTPIASTPVFSSQFYLLCYSDLRDAFGNTNYLAARQHWLAHGIFDGRRASPAFELKWYLDNHQDLLDAWWIGPGNYRSAVDHWLWYGIDEGRRTSYYFHSYYYLMNYPDLIDRYGDRYIEGDGLKDYHGLISHWLNFGLKEGRQGSEDFSIRDWERSHPEVQKLVDDPRNTMGHLIAWYFLYYLGQDSATLDNPQILRNACTNFPG